jgi:predicted transcriptional regulator
LGLRGPGGHIVRNKLKTKLRRRMSLMSDWLSTGVFGTHIPPTNILCVVTLRYSFLFSSSNA